MRNVTTLNKNQCHNVVTLLTYIRALFYNQFICWTFRRRCSLHEQQCAHTLLTSWRQASAPEYKSAARRDASFSPASPQQRKAARSLSQNQCWVNPKTSIKMVRMTCGIYLDIVRQTVEASYRYVIVRFYVDFGRDVCGTRCFRSNKMAPALSWRDFKDLTTSVKAFASGFTLV